MVESTLELARERRALLPPRSPQDVHQPPSDHRKRMQGVRKPSLKVHSSLSIRQRSDSTDRQRPDAQAPLADRHDGADYQVA